MKKKTLVHFLYDLMVDYSNKLGKDVFLVPYYIGKIHNFDTSVAYAVLDKKMKVADVHKNVKLVPVKPRIFLPIKFAIFFYYMFNARKIDYLMLFNFSPMTMKEIIMYKLFNPKGFIYLKADLAELDMLKGRIETGTNTWLRKKYFTYGMKNLNLMSVESVNSYNRLVSEPVAGVDISHKVQLMRNGFDEDLWRGFNIPDKSFAEKENIFLTVGRLGTHQKNTEMVLDALKKVDLKNWKFVLVGSIDASEQDFQAKIDRFFVENPHLKGGVIFTGSIGEKDKLFQWYNRAKVFVLSSRFDGFSHVLTEARRFNNYMLVTDIGGARDTLDEDYKYGELLEQENPVQLAEKMQSIIDGQIDLESLYPNQNPEKLSWGYLVSTLKIPK